MHQRMCSKLNRKKRLVWCKEQLRAKEEFDDVIFTDELTVQLKQRSLVLL